jgi:hypothetical protein
MLQRGCVDHHVRGSLAHRLLKPHFVANVADHHAAHHVGIGAGEFLVDLEDVEFG